MIPDPDICGKSNLITVWPALFVVAGEKSLPGEERFWGWTCDIKAWIEDGLVLWPVPGPAMVM